MIAPDKHTDIGTSVPYIAALALKQIKESLQKSLKKPSPRKRKKRISYNENDIKLFGKYSLSLFCFRLKVE